MGLSNVTRGSGSSSNSSSGAAAVAAAATQSLETAMLPVTADVVNVRHAQPDVNVGARHERNFTDIILL
jgi:hypothetical protein